MFKSLIVYVAVGGGVIALGNLAAFLLRGEPASVATYIITLPISLFATHNLLRGGSNRKTLAELEQELEEFERQLELRTPGFVVDGQVIREEPPRLD